MTSSRVNPISVRFRWPHLGVVVAALLSSCVMTDGKGYQVGYSVLPTTAYSGVSFDNGLTLRSTVIGTDNTYSLINDTVGLALYTDSSCTIPATGSYTLSSATKFFTSGLASFSSVSYTWPVAGYEGSIYFLGSTTRMGLRVCSSAVGIVRHFNSGVGGKSSGTTSAAGDTGASSQDYGLGLAQDSSGRYVITGYSTNSPNHTREATAWRYLPDGTLDSTFGTGGAVHKGTTGVAGATAASGFECDIIYPGTYIDPQVEFGELELAPTHRQQECAEPLRRRSFDLHPRECTTPHS